jgi:excisionase family DNA binding protein
MALKEKYYTVEEIAARLLLNPETVRRWVRNEDLRAYRIGRELRVPEKALKKFLRAREVGGE